MATSPKVLGQLNPAASILTTLYTTPGATKTTVSTIFVCNTGTTVAKFRISVAIAAAADAISQYLYRDETLAPNRTFAVTAGITLGTTDIIRVRADTADVVFHAYGVEFN